jgi:hypothetical protein
MSPGRMLLDSSESMESGGCDMPAAEPILLEPTDVGLVLRLSASSVRRLADEGQLMPVARTRRGVRLFTEADVERLRKRREKARG